MNYVRKDPLKLLNKLYLNNRIANMSKKAKTKATKGAIKEEVAEKVNEPITTDKSKNILITVLAKPGAKQNAITDITTEGVGVQINAPATEGEANAELLKYIASVVGVRKGDVVFERGFKSRTKTIKILGNLSVEEITKRIKEEIK